MATDFTHIRNVIVDLTRYLVIMKLWKIRFVTMSRCVADNTDQECYRDGQTDGRTDRQNSHNIDALCIALCDKEN